jgi:2-polyprenyl-3-methyl-5-hydroxy-6-metoxy-1,4-benzoquinol methylase
MNSKIDTNKDVIDYYSRNWDKIANCYDLDSEGLPIDPAWYRRRLYNQFLSRVKPRSVLDIGCGGGWTVLDALEKGIDAKGIEPVGELVQHGKKLLQSKGYEDNRINQGELASIDNLKNGSQDCIALLSVLPHVQAKDWDVVHRELSRVISPNGHLIAAYRNELFDFFTFNSITQEFYDNSLWSPDAFKKLNKEKALSGLKSLITNPDLPGPYHTGAKDKSFGKLERVKSNALTIDSFLNKYGFKVTMKRFYHFHAVPPLLEATIENLRQVNHDLELSLSDDWRGNFMAPMVLVEAIKGH